MFFKRHVATAIADVKKGFVIRHKNKLCEVMGALHHTKGRGGGHYKLDLKDLKSGSRVSERFNTGIFVETVQKTMRTMQFLYEDKEIHLLDPDTFEEMSVPMHMVSSKSLSWIH
jgi:elongation factor P